MKGIWAWPSEPNDQEKVLQKIQEEDELGGILLTLAKTPQGLSNAKLDKLFSNNSQWRTLLHVRELTALGFIKYEVQFFGEPGEYMLTELGKSVVSRLQASP
jgi:hypothetical protein